MSLMNTLFRSFAKLSHFKVDKKGSQWVSRFTSWITWESESRLHLNLLLQF